MTAVQILEKSASAYGAARAAIQEITTALEAAKKELLADRLQELRAEMKKANKAHDELKELILAHPQLFVKPRTMEHAGVKFGLQAAKASIEIPDEAKTIRIIRASLPDQAGLLIKTEESLVKTSLAALEVKTLRAIGVTSKAGGDSVVIKDAAKDLDKMVERWMPAA